MLRIRCTACVAALGVLVCSPSPASARCLSHALSVTPGAGAQVVPTNVEIFVAAYGHQREKVAWLLDGSHLVSGTDRVPVQLFRLGRQSAESLRMAYLTLKPTRELRPRRHYQLVLPRSKRKAFSKLIRWVRKLRKYSFRTTRGSDRIRPPAPKALQAASFVHRKLGCGPVKMIPLTVALSDDRTPKEGLGVVLHVQEHTMSPSLRERAIRLGRGAVSLGHGMCSGNFRLRPGAVYRVRVSAVDWAGNISAKSPAVAVPVPISHD